MEEISIRINCSGKFCDEGGRGCRFCRAMQTPSGPRPICALIPTGSTPYTNLQMEAGRALRCQPCLNASKAVSIIEVEASGSNPS